MKKLKPVNVLIVGGGWTGLTMAKEITSRTSHSVLVLERGAARKATSYMEGMDELDYSIRLRFDRPLNAFMGAGALGMMIAHFDGDHALNGSEKIVRGGTLSISSSGNRPITSFGSFPAGSAKSNWGSEWKAASLEWRDRVSGVGFTGEHLPYRHNFMDLDPQYKDKMGDPLLRFTLDWTEHEFQQRAYGAEIQGKIARAMGVKFDAARPSRAKYNVVGYQTTHIQGGAIMGSSPENSVVNTNLQHWDVKNLWVVGASAFPQTASGNPTLPVLALTFRAADALIASIGGEKKGAA